MHRTRDAQVSTGLGDTAHVHLYSRVVSRNLLFAHSQPQGSPYEVSHTPIRLSQMEFRKLNGTQGEPGINQAWPLLFFLFKARMASDAHVLCLTFLGPMSIWIDLNSFERKRSFGSSGYAVEQIKSKT